MRLHENRPPFWLSLLVSAVLAALFIYVRLAFFPDRVAGPTLGLPLMICLWNRERSLLWGMTLLFTVVVVLRLLWGPALDLPSGVSPDGWFLWLKLGWMLLNVWGVAVAVHLFIGISERLALRNATLEIANAFLESTQRELDEKEKRIQELSRELELRRAG